MSYLNSFCPLVARAEVTRAWNSILTGIWPEHVAMVKSLKDLGYRTFLLSNTNAIHVEVFERMIDEKMGLELFKGAFEKIYYSNEIGIKKPYPETFLEVCKWNAMKPSTTLFIDDSLQHINGAAEAGLQVFHLENMNLLGPLISELKTAFLNK